MHAGRNGAILVLAARHGVWPALRGTGAVVGLVEAGCGARPLWLGTHARSQARSAPGERLPVRAGWRFGDVGAEGRAGSYVAGIKCIAQV